MYNKTNINKIINAHVYIIIKFCSYLFSVNSLISKLKTFCKNKFYIRNLTLLKKHKYIYIYIFFFYYIITCIYVFMCFDKFLLNHTQTTYILSRLCRQQSFFQAVRAGETCVE